MIHKIKGSNGLLTYQVQNQLTVQETALNSSILANSTNIIQDKE